MGESPTSLFRGSSGQAITEYILLLFMVLVFALLIRAGLRRYQVADLLLAPINQKFAYVYRYGHPQARGFEDGGPKNHPRATSGENSFRLFLNPRKP